MNRVILLLILLITLALPFSGCVDNDGPVSNASSEEATGLTEISSLEEIDQALTRGPVLVEIGSASCPACTAQKPIMEEIAAEYQDKASVMYIDSRSARSAAVGFDIDYVPDSFVIVDAENGQYIYMGTDGQTTINRSSARFIGLTRKETLEAVLAKAIGVREGESDPVEVPEKVGMIEVIRLEDLNQTLSNRPVLVEIGSESCSSCVAQKPIMEEIATEYQKDASIAYVDIKRGRELAVWFGAIYVPDSFIIVNIEDGKYVYMRTDGQTTNDRNSARFLGRVEKGILTETLDKAIEVRQAD
jgi:thioredoxin 1